jgi:hypothetical protein
VTDILAATVPIFMVVGLGYAVTRGGLFKREDMSILSTYVVKLALPMLIFLNVFGRSAEEIFNATYLLTYALTAVVMMGAAFAYARVMGRTALRAAFMGMGMSGTNNGFVGFPIFLIILPEVAGAAVGHGDKPHGVALCPHTQGKAAAQQVRIIRVGANHQKTQLFHKNNSSRRHYTANPRHIQAKKEQKILLLLL